MHKIGCTLLVFLVQIKSNASAYLLYYTEECKELAETVYALLQPGNTASFQEMLQEWQAVGNTESDLTGLRFEPQTSCLKNECVTQGRTKKF